MKVNSPNIILEVTSGLLTPMAFVGFIRIFEQPSDVAPLLLVSLFSTVVAVCLRRLRVSLPLAAVISAIVFAIFAMHRFAGETLRLFLIPTGETLTAGELLWAELTSGFQELVAPVPATDSFLLPSMAVAWVMAFLTDWGALRLRLAFEPVLPAGLVFIFAAVLGTQTNQVFVSAVFVLAVLIWAVAQRSTNLSESNLWLSGQQTRGSSAVAITGAIIGAFAIVSGIVLGPSIPGANGEPRIEINEGTNPARDVESPIVDVERQLGPEQRENVIFTVRANSERYWRTAGLDTYVDGRWIIEGKFKDAGENKTLSGETSSTDTKDTVTQTFQLTSATNIWVPAAYEATSVSDQSSKITWNEGSDSLTVSNDVPSTANLTYTVESNAPIFTPEQLRGADESVSTEIAEQYLALPDDISELVDAEARRVVSGAATRYDQMIALQTYFRSYTYSLDRPAALPGLDPLEDFITQQVGFCQQFAGTFAVMARMLGHPARVATGYTWGTPGEEDADGFRTYTVRGRQAHAWPEVYFGDLGWVSFEPTPGRGSPDGGHTGIEAIQDTSTAADAVPPEQPEEATPPEDEEAPATTTPATEPEDETSVSSVAGGAGSEGSSLPTFPVWVWLPALAVVAYVVAVPTLRKVNHARRRSRATSPDTSAPTTVAIVWDEVLDALAFSFNISRSSSETRTEFAHRLRSDERINNGDLEALAHLATASQYHPTGVSKQDSSASLELSSRLVENSYSSVPRITYWARVLHPARVLARLRKLLKSATSTSKRIEHLSMSTPQA